MNRINQCYEILGLQPGASLEQVKQAYRDLAMVWHPDRFSHNPRLQEKAQEELKKINEAYEVLISSHFSSSTQTPPPNPYQPEPKDAKAYYNQGMDKAKRGKYKEAIDDFSNVISINPTHVDAYKYRGIAYSKIENNQRAIEDLRKAADLLDLQQGNISSYQDIIERLQKIQLSESDTTVWTSCRKLKEFLMAGQWKEADRATLTIMLQIIGERNHKRGKQALTYEQEIRFRELMLEVFGRESENYQSINRETSKLSVDSIKSFPVDILKTIDELWINSSEGRFGFSIQKRLWQTCNNFTSMNYKLLSETVGWRFKHFETDHWILKENPVFSLNAPIGHLAISWSISKQGNVDFRLLNSMFSRPDL